MFHAYWAMNNTAAHSQYSIFFERIAIMGGMLYVVAFGAGPYSIDATIGSEAGSIGSVAAAASATSRVGR